MENFVTEVQIRWSDIDPNFHLRHSVYYDWGALVRVQFLNKFGLTTRKMQELNFGPILFREECIFRREIRAEDKVTMDLRLASAKKDFSRWTIRHEIIKNGDTTAAILTVDGAWMDTIQRKLATPPQDVTDVFDQMPKEADFQWRER
jgi:acyl-CoA thioester hydrolase